MMPCRLIDTEAHLCLIVVIMFSDACFQFHPSIDCQFLRDAAEAREVSVYADVPRDASVRAGEQRAPCHEMVCAAADGASIFATI